jgi:hypothetical protein
MRRNSFQVPGELGTRHTQPMCPSGAGAECHLVTDVPRACGWRGGCRRSSSRWGCKTNRVLFPIRHAPDLQRRAEGLSQDGEDRGHDQPSDPRHPTMQALEATFQTKNRRLVVQPFDVKLGGMTINVSGSNGFDQSLEYTPGLKVPRSHVTRGIPMLLGTLGRVLTQNKGFCEILRPRLINGDWLLTSGGKVLQSFANHRNPAAHSRVVSRDDARQLRNQLLGVGGHGELVHLAGTRAR